MVTNVVEVGQQKCERYWPSQGTQEYGPFKVTLTDQQVFADYTIRQLLVAVSCCGNLLLSGCPHTSIGSVTLLVSSALVQMPALSSAPTV